MRSDLAEIVWMMNNHSRSIEVEVELLWLGEMERWQEVMAHPTVIDGGAMGVKGVGLTDKGKDLPAPLPPASRESQSIQA